MKKLLLLIAALIPCTAHSYSKQDKFCLARNIYHEARGEPLHGKLAVAQVTLNRWKASNRRRTLCEIVYAPRQFSWTHLQHGQLEIEAWLQAVRLAHQILQRGYALRNFSATHFHAQHVRPQWSFRLEPVAVISKHIFYR
jgi:spore germination cell wall hydrolase CwlJ-like protein